jgi:3-oxoacyl-[acyl-carrier-protein] synthase-1
VRRAGIGIAATGLATPIGIGKAAVARALFAGERGGLVPRAGFVPGRTLHIGAISSPLPPIPPALGRYDTRNNRLMLAALQELAPDLEVAIRRFGRERIAVVMGTSTSGIAEGEAAYSALLRTGAWPETFHYCQQETGNLSDFVARLLNLRGPAYTVATACSSSAKVLATGRRLIRAGFADAALVGGADSLCKTTVGGFAALEAVATERCNPFSVNRTGINIGEAAAAFLLTPDETPVRLAGLGESADAHHVSAPHPEGRGATAAMEAALADAGLDPAEIAYINLHGTGTPLNDAMEGKAVHALLGSRVPCSSTKSMTGHTLGAAGACEAAFLWLTLHPEHNPQGRLPPHVWDGAADPAIPPLALVEPGTCLPDPRAGAAMLSSSFAFGGSNVVLAFSREALA